MMHKWHVSAYLGRGRPLSDITKVSDSIALSLRQFHISAVRAQDEEPPPSQQSTYRPRRERLQNTTQEIQNLYNRSAARSNPAPFGERPETSYRSIKLDPSAPSGPAAAIDARSLASRSTRGSRPAVPALRGRPRFGNSGRGDRVDRVGDRGGRGGRGGGGARGGRGGREREDRGPRRRMGPSGEVTEKTNNNIEYTEAEKAYMKYRHGMSYTREEPYQIQDLTQEMLVGRGPAIVVGEFGMAETVEERLRLLAKKNVMEGLAGRVDVIRRVMAGEFVRFENEQEKEEVLAEAERISKREAELKSEETGEIVESEWTEFVGLEGAERKAVVESVLKGQYTIEAEGAEGIMAHLMRNASRNESYLPKDGSALLEKVRTVLSTQKARPAAKPTAVN